MMLKKTDIFDTKKVELLSIDKEISNCTLCESLVEKFPESNTVSVGKDNRILIVVEAPANNGWRKTGIAWYDINEKLLPSGVVMQKLLDIINIKLSDTYFLESVKCYPLKRNYLKKCSKNCYKFLLKQIAIINPKIILFLGDYATKSILNIKYSKFGDVVGKTYYINNSVVIPIYHPSPISPLGYKGNIEIFKSIERLL